ncbi:MAG TPA: hypothetical protein VK826_16650 [Bacteroidia bacterium]|nr:hypothetical protein [Bacteroidia bacterium]
MRPFLFTALLIFTLTTTKAQDRYFGATLDYNSGIGERYTYGLGLHLEANVWKSKNLYFNWHYSLGFNTHSEFYGHGGISLLLYKSRDWWMGGDGTWEGALAILIGPLICPNGVTYYFPMHSTAYQLKPFRFGVYCNPLGMDYWDLEPFKVTSWTVETGAKVLYHTHAGPVWYLAAGVSFTNNIRRQGRVYGYGNEQLVQVQLGLLHGRDER